MAFDVGDKVVYPHHGAAVIERRERRDAFGADREYLVLRLAYGDLTLMVPADNTDEVGLREVINDEEVALFHQRDYRFASVVGAFRDRDAPFADDVQPVGGGAFGEDDFVAPEPDRNRVRGEVIQGRFVEETKELCSPQQGNCVHL